MYESDITYHEFEGAEPAETLADKLNRGLTFAGADATTLNAPVSEDDCPHCGCKLVRAEGCRLCQGCGYGVCG